MKLKVIITPGEDSGFVAQVPALRGCWTQGPTRDEALANAREAIEAWLETEQDKDDKSDVHADVELVTV
jgi:predicted RNase H-like HicB family nuclease